jgi:peroxiredoxin
MKCLTLIVFLFFVTPLSILGQKEIKFSTTRDSIGIVTFYYADGEMSQNVFYLKDSMALDSIKKELCPYLILNKEKKRKAKRDNTIKALINSRVPDFEAPDTMGMMHRPSHYIGRVLVLHFWNFWDYSFEREIPVLNQMVEKYRKDGLEVLSFMDIPLGLSEKNKLQKTPIDFPLIPNSWQFSNHFLTVNTSKPYLVLIDKSGNIRHLFIHYEWQWDRDKTFNASVDLEEKIATLLKE